MVKMASSAGRTRMFGLHAPSRARLFVLLALVLGPTASAHVLTQSNNLSANYRRITQLEQIGNYAEAIGLADHRCQDHLDIAHVQEPMKFWCWQKEEPRRLARSELFSCVVQREIAGINIPILGLTDG